MPTVEIKIDPLTQMLETLRQWMDSPAPVTNTAMIRQLVAAEYAHLESPAPINFIGDAERQLFEQHQDKVQAFLASDDGADAGGIACRGVQGACGSAGCA